jgi:putative endonuclease
MRFFLKNKVGSLGEKLGSKYLRDKGYKILETNYCNTTGKRLGEIDIIAKKDGRIVFVEVKTRTVGAYAGALPEENIGRDKLRKLERIAACYLREKKLQDIPYAFDALAIMYDPDSEQAEIRHLESIFL